MQVAITNKMLCVMAIVLFTYSNGTACDQCTEVAKEKIPAKFLDATLKKLPSGITIWDEEEALVALNDPNSKILWVDTRPSSFYNIGTIKGAELMIWDQTSSPVPAKDKEKALTKEKLMAAMASKSKVAFFCQGPKCHRSYNAALVAVKDYQLAPSQVIWFRAGYPLMLEMIKNDPKLQRKQAKYLQNIE